MWSRVRQGPGRRETQVRKHTHRRWGRRTAVVKSNRSVFVRVAERKMANDDCNRGCILPQILVVSAGVAYLIVGIVFFVKFNALVSFIGNPITFLGIALIVAGIIAVLVRALFVVATISNRRPTLYKVTLGLSVIMLLAAIGVGIAGYTLRKQAKDQIASGINSAMNSTNLNSTSLEALNKHQTELHCCGSTGPNSWLDTPTWENDKKQIPKSCCKNVDHCTRNLDPSINNTSVYPDGCIEVFDDWLHQHGAIFSGIILLFAAFEVLAYLFYCLKGRRKN